MTKQTERIQQTSSPSRLETQLTRRLLSLLVVALLANCASAQTSDNNWTNVGSVPGADGPVYATAVDGAGNLYIGGAFTNIGNVVAKI